MKFISLVDFEHEKKPTADGENASRVSANPFAVLVSASCQVATRNTPLSRTIGSVIRMKGSNLCFAIALTLATYAGLPPLKSVSVE